MFNLTRIVHLVAGANPDDFETRLRTTVDAIGTAVTVVGRTLPGAINGGDLIAHMQFADRDEWLRVRTSVDEILASPSVEKVYGVEYHCGTTGRAPGADPGTLYRALLVRVDPSATPESLEQFESDILSMPRHISSMRAWRLSPVETSTGPVSWTHVWEQEFREVGEVTGQYLDHPVHWAVVDRWFDPECPEVVVRDRVCHTFCAVDRVVIGQ